MLVPGMTALVAGVRRRLQGASDSTGAPDPRRRRPIHRCSRCDHPFFDPEREPDAWWFVLCPRCVNDTRRALVALLALYLVVGLMVLLLGAGL